MPFIRGRYHVNPVLGEALEAAREAENALVALEQEQEQESGADPSRAKAPIHRVEIEAAELVPPHSGRGGRGYVARVHRQAADAQGSGDGDDFAREARPAARSNARAVASRTRREPQAETHVFANHGDLVSFLRDELGKDAAQP
jgi:hypothetical protein